MDPQSQIGFGWLWTPSSGGNGILFCNPEQQAITTVTPVPAPVMTVDNNRVVKMDSAHVQLPQQCGGSGNAVNRMGPINYEMTPKNLSMHQNPGHQTTTQTPPLSTSSSSSSSTSSGGEGFLKCGISSSNGDEKSKGKPVIEEDELARRREINRLREKRRREQMTPKERAKARKKNKLRARKRRRNMTPEEREQEKERNRERARHRRTQKLLRDAQQHKNN